MTTISTTIRNKTKKNDRHTINDPDQNYPEKIDTIGTVVFDLVPDTERRTLSLVMTELGVGPGDEPSEDRLVGETDSGEYYLRVPQDKNVQVDLVLSEYWNWRFPKDEKAVTLGDANNKDRYWMTKKNTSKLRRIVIKSSGNIPQNIDDGSYDEKFNLEVLINQASGPELAIEIDPITKNPPPVGGKIARGQKSGPLLV